MRFRFAAHDVCLVEGSVSATGLAVRPEAWRAQNGHLCVEWSTDGSPFGHRRVMTVVRVVRDRPDDLAFVDHVGRRWRLRPLTLSLYRRHLQADMGGRKHESSRTLREFLLGKTTTGG